MLEISYISKIKREIHYVSIIHNYCTTENKYLKIISVQKRAKNDGKLQSKK